jgi:hypothetical protein
MILLAIVESSSSNALISDLLNEKNATSEPEISAEANKSKNNNRNSSAIVYSA